MLNTNVCFIFYINDTLKIDIYILNKKFINILLCVFFLKPLIETFARCYSTNCQILKKGQVLSQI